LVYGDMNFMSENVLEKYIGNNFILLSDKKINFPYNVESIIEFQNNIIILLKAVYPDFAKEKLFDSKAIWTKEELGWCEASLDIFNTNVWCYDFNGNFKWRAPDSYPEKNHQMSFLRTGHRLFVPYTKIRVHPQMEDTLIAFTNYGYLSHIRISDGALIERIDTK
jgi:hypothetical protein